MPYRAGADQKLVPLLPYEYDLINIVGISENEYRSFTERVKHRALTRPTEYAHIPDIQNDPVIISIVGLVLGLVSTGVSLLLQPRPPEIEQSDARRGKTIAGRNIRGQERFGATAGFDSLNELANYAEPIPVIFARRENNIGGVLAGLSLAWSRAFSYGNEQGIKMLFSVGEAGQGIAPPKLEGIFLGNQPLDSAYAHRFAFYWRGTGGRVTAGDLLYGSRGSSGTGDPESSNDIILCPTQSSSNATGFCNAFSPVSNATFGCYGAMANGTGFRVNWRTVPMPTLDNKFDDNDRIAVKERIKIAGDWGYSGTKDIRDLGMKGFGREYNRFMGVVSHNGAPFAFDPNADINLRHKKALSASVGDVIEYFIGGKVMAEDRYFIKAGTDDEIRAAGVDDINNATIQFREQADQTLQLGETIMIGRTVWKVIGRAIPAWGTYAADGSAAIGPYDTRQDQYIRLQCVEVFGSDSGTYFGIVTRESLSTNVRTDDAGTGGEFYAGGTYPGDNAWRAGNSIGPGFFPLMRVDFGIVRNTRACDCTEIGIKSQVWNRANGLCNFSSIPDPKELRRADRQGDSLNSGTFSGYFKRVSVWTILLRPAGVNQEGNPHPWVPLGEQFCVRGAGPYDQYNFIRLIHPQRREYEFRFLPKNGGDLAFNSPDDAVFWLLDASAGSSDPNYKLEATYTTAYGAFTVVAPGRTVLKGALEFNPEMSSGLDSSGFDLPAFIEQQEQNSTSFDITGRKPDSFNVLAWMPDIDDSLSKASSVIFQDGFLPETAGAGRESSFCAKIAGTPPYVGYSRSVDLTFYEEPGRTRWMWNVNHGGRWITVRCNLSSWLRYPPNHPFEPNGIAWNLDSVSFVNSSVGFNAGEWLRLAVDLNPFDVRNWYGLDWTGIYVGVSSTTSAGVAPGRESAFNWEVFGEAMNYPLGQRRTVTRAVPFPGGRTVNVKFTAETIPTLAEWREIWGTSRTYTWKITGASAECGTATGNYGIGDTADYIISISGGNPFGNRYRGTGAGPRLRVATLVPSGTCIPPGEIPEPEVVTVPNNATGTPSGGIRQSIFTKRRVFERNSQITDMSMYLERITSNESRPEHEIVYVNESVENEITPTYDKLGLAALALRAGQSFNTVDQVRVWLESGASVTRRFHPNDAGSGPSNMLPDLAYFLLTDTVAGIGKNFPEALIDTDSFVESCKFLRANNLFFNGAVTEQSNIRSFLSQVAPSFMLAFVIQDGKFALRPGLPTTSGGALSTGPLPISALFTSGNIIENSFKLEYISAEQRQDFQAMMRWRDEQPNKFPLERTVVVRRSVSGSEAAPYETTDMTQFCCSEEHAILVAKYFLSLRNRITHTVSFKTTPEGMRLAPGDYIRVVTEASPYNSANNGVIDNDGTVVATSPLNDGVYPIIYYSSSADDLVTTNISISGGKVSDANLFGIVFSVSTTETTTNVYQIEQLTIDEDGLVEIGATEHPTDDNLSSLIVQDVLSNAFIIER